MGLEPHPYVEKDVYDDLIGKMLNGGLVRTAMEEALAGMYRREFWGEVDVLDCITKTGSKPIPGGLSRTRVMSCI